MGTGDDEMKRINLLPKPKQQELVYEQLFYGVIMAVSIAIAVLLIGVVVQLGVGAYLDRNAQVISSEIEQLKRIANKSENAEIKERIKLMNAQIGDFNNLAKSTPQWSGVLEAFVINVPAGVRITQFDAKAETQEIKISGYSPTRDLVIDLYNNINADKEHFKDIDYPLENVTQPTNVRFTFTFTIAEGILLKGIK